MQARPCRLISQLVGAALMVLSAADFLPIRPASAAIPAKYTLTDLHAAGADPSIALGINNHGDIVGSQGPNAWLNILPAPPIGSRAFLYSAGSPMLLNPL